MKIKKHYLEYLVKNVKENHLKAKFANTLKNSHEVFLSGNERDLLLDELTDLLVKEGFDETEKANPTGTLIEEIIDLINGETRLRRTDFNDFCWHDANLKFINIERENPGNSDTFRLKVVWPDSNNSTLFEFYGCYALQLNMNFGMIVEESILSAEIIRESRELDALRQAWFQMGVKLDKLNCYCIETNTTNSSIKIYANGFIIHDNVD